MALSPSIPTSFVPKQPVSPSKRPRSSGNNIFLAVSIIIFAVAVIGAGGIYLYGYYLSGVEKAKAAQVAAAEASVSPSTVQQFIQLRDRLSEATMLLNQHVELSQFFGLLESITLQNVNFSSLKVTVNADRSATINMTGTARNFNALAAESAAFAAQKNVKSAIFSGISVNKDNTVSFTLDAILAPAVVVEASAPSSPTVLPGTASSSTPASTPAFTTSSVKTAPLATSSAKTASTSP